MNCPCNKCAKRKAGMACKEKMCLKWKKWWIETWDTNRLKVLEMLLKKEAENEAEVNENTDESV